MEVGREVLPVQDRPPVQTAHYDAQHEDVEYAPFEEATNDHALEAQTPESLTREP